MRSTDLQITAKFGERCPDYDPDCLTCRAWALRDVLAAMLATTHTKEDG